MWHSYWSTIMWLVCHSSWIHVRYDWVCIPKQQQRHDGRHRWIGNCWWLNCTPLIDWSFTCTWIKWSLHRALAYISSRRRVNLPHVSEVVRSVICLQCWGPHSSVVNLLSLKAPLAIDSGCTGISFLHGCFPFGHILSIEARTTFIL